MKRKTFYYISLALPYFAFVFSSALSFLAYQIGIDSAVFDGLLGILAGTLIFFSVSAIVWGPLYTWAVIAMLFWGRGKNADELRRAYLFLPVLLGCSMGIPAMLFYSEGSVILLGWGVLHLANLDLIARVLFKDYPVEQSLAVGMAWAFMAAVCIVVGYMFIGIVLLIERVMQRRNLFREAENADRMPPVP